MPTPTERLETKRQIMACRVCAWMSTLDEKTRKSWAEAVNNTRYSNGMVANEIMVDIATSEYQGEPIGESSIATHRRGMHR